MDSRWEGEMNRPGTPWETGLTPVLSYFPQGLGSSRGRVTAIVEHGGGLYRV